MTNVIQTKVMKDHETPIIILEFSSDIASDVVVYLGEVLEELHVSMEDLSTWESETAHRDEEARRSILTVESGGKQLQPGVIAEH